MAVNWIRNLKGGAGSGNFEHSGREGKVGGSANENNYNAQEIVTKWHDTVKSPNDLSLDISSIGRQKERLLKLASSLEKHPWQQINKKNRSDILDLRKKDLLEVAWDKEGNSYYALLGTPRNKELFLDGRDEE